MFLGGRLGTDDCAGWDAGNGGWVVGWTGRGGRGQVVEEDVWSLLVPKKQSKNRMNWRKYIKYKN